MLTETQIQTIKEQLQAARDATSHAHKMWRRVAVTVAEFYDLGQSTKPRTTGTAIADAIGVSPQQVSRWRQKVDEA